MNTQKFYLVGILPLLAALLLPVTGFAQQAPTLTPSRLEFSLQTGDSLTLFTTLNTPVDLTNLVVENNGLVNDAKTANLPPAKVILAPASGDIPAGLQSLAVTIQQPEQPGHYTGQLVLRFAGAQPADTQPVTLDLDVTVAAAANVTASTASPNQTLQLRPSFFFIGRCPAGASACTIPGNQIVITLEQTGPGEARIMDVKIDPLRSSEHSRPGSVMTFTMPDSAPASSIGAAPIATPYTTTVRSLDLTVQADSWDIPPGSYSSGLRLTVAGQANAVTVPFTVKSKAGLFWPALIAALGILFGYISYRLNQRINPLMNVMKEVEKIQAISQDPCSCKPSRLKNLPKRWNRSKNESSPARKRLALKPPSTR